MARALIPAAPDGEHAARLLDREPIAPGSPLSRELADFLQSGIAVCLAATAPDRSPIAGVALACLIDASGVVRVLLSRSANLPLLASIQAGSGVAVTFTRPHNHRSIQLKAMAARIDETRESDSGELARQCQGLRRELIEAGYEPIMSVAYTGFRPDDVVAVELVPERIFVQTPGPGAGSELAT